MKVYYSLDSYDDFRFWQDAIFRYCSMVGCEITYNVNDINNILNANCHDNIGLNGACFGAKISEKELGELNSLSDGGTLIAINKNVLAVIIFLPSSKTKDHKDVYGVIKYIILNLRQGIYRVLIDTYENNKYVYFRGGKNSYPYVEKCLDVLSKKSSFIGFDDMIGINNELSRYQPRAINIDGEEVYINMFEELQ